MSKIFLTGITGFLGSNIAEFLAENGHEIIAIHRSTSSRELCGAFGDKVKWINTDEINWEETVINAKPEVIIHAAWLGVTHEERDSWESQLLNLDFLKTILFIAQKCGSKQFISLGSQAEYGAFEGKIDESQACKPYHAYGCVKKVCAELVKQFCTYHHIKWYWLRLFSFFGKGESERWLIPSLVKNIMTTDHMDFTAGEQKYSYLYVKDLAYAISLIIEKEGLSDIYNISGSSLLTLRNLIEKIRDNLSPGFQLNFGKLPYRQNQPMLMQGDSAKFIKEFGVFEVSDFDVSLNSTIESLKNNLKKQMK